MTLKDKQISALVDYLNHPKRDDQTVEQVAEDIVDAFYSMLKGALKEEPPDIKSGEPFKHLITGKIHTPMWQQDDLWWIVTPDSNYGYLGVIQPWKRYAIPTKAAATKSVNLKGWKVDDRVSFGQGQVNGVIVATTEKSVLLIADGESRPIPEPNDLMERFYKKIKPKVNLF